jgi:hypothetical protein
MSTTVPVDVAKWDADSGGSDHRRPQFANPVPARVTAGGRDVGELDAFLQWDDDTLVARIGLPALPGHVIQARCSFESEPDPDGSEMHPWIRSLDVSIEHVDEESIRGARFEDRGMAERTPRGDEARRRSDDVA